MTFTNEKPPPDTHMEKLTNVPSDKSDSDESFEVTWTEEEETRVRHKLDWQIVCLPAIHQHLKVRLMIICVGADGDYFVPDVLPGSVR